MSDITLAQFQLKCQFFPALFQKDQEKDNYHIINSDEKVSKYMFPIITQVIKCGSRAEQIYLDSSDIDYIYEVGPFIVKRKRSEGKTFYFNITKNPGFYTVCDEEGGYIYPKSLQSTFAPVIHGVKQVASLEGTHATLPSITLPPEKNERKREEMKDKEDSVIALKCEEWPEDVWKKFKERNLVHVNLQQLKETSLYLIPKAHPNSEKPWLEWRLSFSLVERRICESIPYIFRKVYLICKSLTIIWKGKCNFPSYVLKTAFLWTYEHWQKSGKQFTEDHILEMVLELFENLYKYYIKGVVPMYFNQEVNIIDQYPETEKCDVIIKLKPLTNLESLSSLISEISEKSFRSFQNSFAVFEWGFPDIHTSLNGDPFYPNLHYLCSEKIYQNKGITNNEDKLEFLHELYLNFLLLLQKTMQHDVAGNPVIYNLYYLMIYAHNYIANDILCDVSNFIMKYNASFREFLDTYFPDDVYKLLKRNESDVDGIIKLETQRILRKRYKKDKLPEMWINGDLDNHDIPIVHDMYKFGNKKHSEKLYKEIMEHNFSKFDLALESLVNNLNSYFSEKFKKSICLKVVASTEYSRYHMVLQNRCALKYLVQDMFEMYSYGFTDGKFHLPTPAVYMSYLRQLAVNRTCKLQNENNNDKQCCMSTNDQWGFFVKEGSYVTYLQRKATTIPFDWTFIHGTVD